MSDPTFTAAELHKFDRLTLKLSSPKQMERLNARFKLNAFIKEHGTPKCDAVWKKIKAKDAKRKSRQ